MDIANDEGIKVEVRKVSIDEVMNGDFTEIAACKYFWLFINRYFTFYN